MSPKFESINCICPIYAASDRGRANLIGTATLLDFGRARFLVTAAHVHDEYLENNAALYVGTTGPLLELPQPFKATVAPHGKRADDRLDFAFVKLPAALADKIAKGRFFLPFQMIDANDNFKPRARYMFTGFPGSREKTDYKNKKVKPTHFSFTGIVVPPTRMAAFGLHMNTHIVVEFERECVLDRDGKTSCFPSPRGMSGGAVWHGDGDFRLWLTELPARLVGIGIENLENQDVLVAVRIHLVLAAIAKCYPDLDEFIPKRLGFTNDITIVPWQTFSKLR